jgi:hypothetical protein
MDPSLLEWVRQKLLGKVSQKRLAEGTGNLFVGVIRTVEAMETEMAD